MDNHSDSTVVGPSLVPKLEIIRGDGVGTQISLKFKTRIGREADNDIVLADPRISRYHCQVTFEDAKWLLTDLGSANGTLLGGMPVSVPQPLSHGSQIQVGETILAFVDPIDEKEHPIDPSMTIIGGQLPPNIKARAAASDSGSTPRMAWIAGGLVLILLVAVAGMVLWQRRTPAAPPVAIQPTTDTSAATPSPAPINEPPLALKFEDDFSASSSGWDDAFSKDYTKQYGNNQYHIEITTNNLAVWGLANRSAADFEVEVEVSLEDSEPGNTYGLIFRYEDHNNYYRFDVSDDGYFLLSKFEAGVWQTLIDWTPSPAIKQGTTTNVLKIAAFGPEIAVFANGQELGRATDGAIQAGNFGFFASTFNGPHIWVSYDNLKLWTPAEQEIAIIPTAVPTRPALTEAQSPDAPAQATEAVPGTPAVAEPATPQAEAAPLPQTMSITATEIITAAEEPTPVPIIETPEPLPSFVSRDQPLARGESQLPGKLIFPVYDPARGTYDIFRANLDGSEREQLFAEASQPAANKSGNTIAYRSWKADERGLIVQELGSPDHWLFEPYFEAASPVFSLNDDFFVYHSRAGRDTPALYRTMGTESQVLRRESIPIEGEMSTFTPDGKLVYKGCLGNTCGLILTNLDGGAPLQLTGEPGDTAPSVSPDGQTVAFMSDRDGDWEVYIVGIDGQNLQRLTDVSGEDGLPAWSPDGSRLAFVSNRDGLSAIWVMTPAGRQKHQLFALDGPINGIVQVDTAHAFGWLEERIVWTK